MVRGKDFDRPGIGFGMIPRGEVGLVFAAFCLQPQRVQRRPVFRLVLVVLLTTLVGPLLLKPRLARF